MEWVIYLFGGGIVFFIGVGLLLFALVILCYFERGWLKRLATIVTLTGLILIALSATPLPIWFYLVAAGGTFAWLAVELSQKPGFQRHKNRLRFLVLALWGTGVAFETPYHFRPNPTLNKEDDLYIIGDSVAAGMGDHETGTWPRLLSQTGGRKIHDFSRVGATASSALKQAQGLPAKGGIVLLEIGGNDLLGSTTSEKFERDLGELLNRVGAPERTVLMFELPLLPFSNKYGSIQRRLAARHGVVLIPKRFFAEVISAEGATLDSLHLSKHGHQKMAELVRSFIGP